MKPPTGSPPLHLASSETEETLVARSEERLQAVLATLEKCRATLVENGAAETVQLVSVAILQLRMKLHRISDTDLTALCDVMLPEDGPRDPKSSHAQRRRAPPMLKLVE